MKIDNKNYDLSLNDTTELRRLIIENPDLPLLIFAGEESWIGEWAYNQVDARVYGIEHLTLYKDIWLEKEDYVEKLANDLANEEEYKHLSDKEYCEMIDKMVEETEFIEAIVVYVG